MATAEEGGATANTTTSSYGGGGAGGKFRKKPFRRKTRSYDRRRTAFRGNNNNNNNSSWLTELVVEPGSRLISYGPDRFFASVFLRHLPSPPPQQPPEVNADVSDGDQGAGLNNQDSAKEPGVGECSQPINSSSSNGVVELEQLLKQMTFTRSMNAEDSMAEDPVPSSAPVPVFGQPSVSPSPPGFTFGSTVPSQTSPFMFGGQQNQVAPQNPSPFQALGSLEFNVGGSFSFGSGVELEQLLKQMTFTRSLNAEDRMAEDPVPSSAPVPVFGQPSVSPSAPGFTFGSTVPSQTSPFMFSGQQNQVAPHNPSPFPASGSPEFNAGGSFSLGSGGGDKSGRKIVKINRNMNRKK